MPGPVTAVRVDILTLDRAAGWLVAEPVIVCASSLSVTQSVQNSSFPPPTHLPTLLLV